LIVSFDTIKYIAIDLNLGNFWVNATGKIGRNKVIIAPIKDKMADKECDLLIFLDTFSFLQLDRFTPSSFAMTAMGTSVTRLPAHISRRFT
jgi:hypothetical protein